jgi:hypothetical protein
VAATVSVVLTAAVLGCGGGGASAGAGDGDTAARSDSTPAPSTTAAPQPAAPPSDLDIPAKVPQRATGPADGASVRVIRRWLAALDRGDIPRAAHFFALPSKFQNAGTPVLTVDSEIERLAVNTSLSCGARAIRTGGAGPYTIVTFRLIERPGGACGPGTGQTARGAILVRRGRIREWYRLPDVPADSSTPEPAGPSA